MFKKSNMIWVTVLVCMAVISVFAKPKDSSSHRTKEPGRGYTGRKFRFLNLLKLQKVIVAIRNRIFFGILRGLKNGIEYFITRKLIPAIRVGQALINPPLKAEEYMITTATNLARLGAHLRKKILSDIEHILTGNWTSVKAVDFPGSDGLVLVYPTGLCSVLSNAVRTVMHLGFAIEKDFKDHIKATLALGIYSGVNLVMAAFKKALRMFGDCLPLPPMKVPVKNVLISSVQSEKTKVCGLSSLHPSYNVTLTRDDEHFLIIRMPLECNNLHIHSEGLTVPDGSRLPFIDNEPLDINITTVQVSSEIRFRAGSILKFLRIHFTIEKLENFKMEFKSKSHSPMMDTVEALSGYIGGVVKKQINSDIKKLETLVSDVIEGRASHSK